MKKSPFRITWKISCKASGPPSSSSKNPRWRTSSDSRPQRGTSGTFTGHAGRRGTAPGVRGGAMPTCAGAGQIGEGGFFRENP